jgi:hypothetical protein
VICSSSKNYRYIDTVLGKPLFVEDQQASKTKRKKGSLKLVSLLSLSIMY